MSSLVSAPPAPVASAIAKATAESTSAVSMICHCLGITEADVRRSIDSLPNPTLESVSEHTGAGSGCTGCRQRVQRLIDGKPAACGRFGPCDHCGSCRAICGCEVEPAPVLCRSHCQPNVSANS